MSDIQAIKLTNLPLGQKATIHTITDKSLSAKFYEMGCLPGESIEVKYLAPLGDPIAVEVSGYVLSLRRAEAQQVEVVVCD